jgi:hypothetical protein
MGVVLILCVVGHLATLVPFAAAAASGLPAWSELTVWCFGIGQVIMLAGCVGGWVRTRNGDLLIGWACGLVVVPLFAAAILFLAFLAYGGN